METLESTKSVAVCYLARLSSDPTEIERFLVSYVSNQTKVKHSLIIIAKGESRSKDLEDTDRMLKRFKIEAITYWVSDTIGYDIHAYKTIFDQVNSRFDFFIFLKTSSQITSPQWLEVYLNSFNDAEVGIVGATASYESLNSSWHAILNAQNKFFAGEIGYIEALHWIWILSPNGSKLKLFAVNTYFHLKKFVKKGILYMAINEHELLSQAREAFLRATSDGQAFNFLKDFPLFPNPHIRTSAFMIRTSTLNLINFELSSDRTSVAKFESGSNSLTNQIQALGLKAVVVGVNQKTYDLLEWKSSETFRELEQRNLVISDNRTDDYKNMDTRVRNTHQSITWGNRNVVMGVNFKFDSESFSEINPDVNPPMVSIVIPSHNGNSMIRETINTVLKQSYENLEIIVFDNASQPPLQPELLEISDPRLKLTRSSDFLSVTESWNAAIDLASGDYVMLFGDDDGLAPNFSKDFSDYIKLYDCPEVIYSNIFQVIYPGVKEMKSKCEFKFHPVAEVLEDLKSPKYLDMEERTKMVKDSLNLKRSFFYNMPSFIVKKSLLNELKVNGKVFVGPFPDYYIANVLFAKAKKLLIAPNPISFQGISKKSFGHSLMTNTTETGFKRLGFDTSSIDARKVFEPVQIKRSRYVDEFVLTMIQVEKILNKSDLKVNLARYRRITLYAIITEYSRDKGSERKIQFLIGLVRIIMKSGSIKNSEYFFVLRVLGVMFLALKFPNKFMWLFVEIQKTFNIMKYSPLNKIYRNARTTNPNKTYDFILNINNADKSKDNS